MKVVKTVGYYICEKCFSKVKTALVIPEVPISENLFQNFYVCENCIRKGLFA